MHSDYATTRQHTSRNRRARLASLSIAALLIGGVGIAGIGSAANAATVNKAGGACKTEGAKTMIGLKSYTCTNTSKTKTKKLVWSATPTLGAAGGAIGGPNGGPDGGPNDPGQKNFAAMQKAFAAYSACLVKNGGTAQTFGRRFPGGQPGTTPGGQPGGTTGGSAGGFGNPGARPTPSAAQLKAEAACASLRPQFGGRGGFGGGPQGGPDDNLGGTAAPLVLPSKSPSA